MKKFLSLFGVLALGTSTVASVVSFTTTTSVKEDIFAKVDLNDVVRNRDLGEFNWMPSIYEIMNRINFINQGLNLTFKDVRISKIEKVGELSDVHRVWLKANEFSTKYTGEVALSFIRVTLKPDQKDEVFAKVDLSDAIKNKDLGVFKVIPTPTQVVKRVNELNSSLRMTMEDVFFVKWERVDERVNDDNTQAIENYRIYLKANEFSPRYTGNAQLTFRRITIRPETK